MRAADDNRNAFKAGMTRVELAVVICVMCLIVILFEVFARSTRADDVYERHGVVMNIRNCQQAMRGEQNMRSLVVGDAFTQSDLEEFMQFPHADTVEDGVILYVPGVEIMPESDNPAVNGNHLWLKLSAPETKGYVGKYGFKDISESTGW